MNTYQIKVKYTFEGVVDVVAPDKDTAKEIVDKGFGMTCNVSKPSWTSDNPDDEGISDWEIDIHPTGKTLK